MGRSLARRARGAIGCEDAATATSPRSAKAPPRSRSLHGAAHIAGNRTERTRARDGSGRAGSAQRERPHSHSAAPARPGEVARLRSERRFATACMWMRAAEYASRTTMMRVGERGASRGEWTRAAQPLGVGSNRSQNASNSERQACGCEIAFVASPACPRRSDAADPGGCPPYPTDSGQKQEQQTGDGSALALLSRSPLALLRACRCSPESSA